MDRRWEHTHDGKLLVRFGSPMTPLADDFPFKDVFEEFLAEYARCPTYWYIPHTRSLNDENVDVAARVLRVVYDSFLDRDWTRETQDEVLEALRGEGLADPTTEGGIADRTALTRIWKIFFEVLGLLWVQEDKEIIITDAGLDLIDALEKEQPLRPIVSDQIAKLQYPLPSIETAYMDEFQGILPHLFLLQVIDETGHVSYDEFDLFLNLAGSHDDLPRILKYIETWRDLEGEHRDQILDLAKRVPRATLDDQLPLGEDYEELEPEAQGTRYLTIKNIRSYQRAFFGYPEYVRVQPSDSRIDAADAPQLAEVVERVMDSLKITVFDTLEDWIAYYGDPEQKPDWFTYLSFQVTAATTEEEAREKVAAHEDEAARKLTGEEEQEIKRLQIEKGIEEFYVDRLPCLEDGLALVEDGRQYTTPIGRIDLLCQGSDGKYVVVEIKAKEADDAVFGQIQRYIGWVHRNIDDGRENVRGIILATGFPEKARYSRIGLMRDDYDEFLQFRRPFEFDA